jgi:hypothetical protein
MSFVQAQDLHVGDILQTTTGQAQVTNLHLYHADTTTYDLTIGALHTFYVVAGDTSVLVHNCDNGTVARNALGDAEYDQADAFVNQLGGHFEGQQTSNQEGIDGFYDDIPTSLKEVLPGSKNNIKALANTVTRMQDSASKANDGIGYSDVWGIIRAQGMTRAEVLTSSRIPEVMGNGIISRVSVQASDGWVHFF